MKKKAADSFSGIPDTVLGSKGGKIINKNEDNSPIIDDFLEPKEFRNITLTKRKRGIIVSENMKAGNIADDCVTDVLPNRDANLWNQAII